MNSEPPASPENDPNLSDLGRAMLGGDSAASRPSGKPSAVWEPPTADELHKLLPQYEIVKMLGRGGMGAVYMGRQISLDRPVAIKILSATLGDADVGFSERFKNEARAMAKLNHPGIVSVHDFGETEGGLLYIVMEYVDGTDVARMIAANGRLHTEHAMAITAHVCDALSYAHERGIIHRDIKPANIMVGYDGSVKVADFGLAKVSTSNGSTVGLTQSGMAMGTLHFMAPEALVLGSSVDHRADIYAVGVMLYQMLTGKLPHGMFELPSIQVKGLDPRYDGIIARSMREDREVRYQSASELRRDLDAILTQPVVKAEAPTNSAPPQLAAAKLPTGARPKRPTGQPYRPQQGSNSTLSRPAPQKSHSGFWVAVTLLLAGGVGAWFFLQNRKAQTIDPTTVTPSESRLGCAVTLRTPDAARVLSLEKGQPRLYDSDPLRVIEEMDPLLKGWQFTSIPQRIDNEYEVSVSQPGTLIAFGGLHKGFTKEDVFGKEAPQWQTDDQAIKGTMIKMCYRREVKAGEIIKMKAFELQLAAAKIEIEKSAPAVAAAPQVTQPPVSVASARPPLTNSTSAPSSPSDDNSTWVSLFNGKDLSGWRIIGDSRGFTVDQGRLRTGGVRADLIYTGTGSAPAIFGDFELRMKVKTGDKGNSGLWFHLPTGIQDTRECDQSLQVQIDNGFDKQRTGSIVHIVPLDQSPVADGEWFELRVVVQSGTVTSFVDGKQVNQWTQPSQWQPPSKAALAKMGTGAIGLESWKGMVWFQDIQLRTLSDSALVSKLESPRPTAADDWQPLFPTNTLAGWTGDVAGYRIANGILTSTDKGGDLISPKEYGSFHLKFDLRLTVGANNGIGVWCADNKGPYNFVGHTGFEIQLIDDNLPTYTKGDGWHLHGALSYFLTPKAKPMGLPGSWNSHELRIEGTHITLLINDKIVLDEELPRGDPVSGGSRRHRLDFSRQRGHLVFCGMKGPVEFRNVMIREIDEKKSVSPTPPSISPPETLWIDAKGRSLQAKFVRVEGAHVILNIAGKVTPVAMNTLSNASQEIALALQQSLLKPAATHLPTNEHSWLMGLWEQRNDGANIFNYLAFLEDGTAGFAWLNKEMGLDGRWQITGDELRVVWPNGCIYRIDLGKGTLTRRTGSGVGGTPSQFTLEIKHTGKHPAKTMPSIGELEGMTFDFTHVSRGRTGSNGVLTLLKGGSVTQQSPMNITGWKVAGGFLMLMNSRHECVTLFDDFQMKNGKWSIEGQFIQDAAVKHRLEQQLPSPAAGSSISGFQPLFPSDSLSGWTGDTSAYRYANDILTGTGKGDLISPQEYGNFHLKFDLRISAEANSGIGIWRDAATGATAGAPRGVEVQIQDDTAPKYRSQDFWQRHGGIYYFKEPLTLAMNAVGSWNTHEILVEGTQIKVTVNGKLVQDADVTKLRPVTARAPSLDVSRKRGHLIILGRNGVVEFRNMQIKELP